MIPDIEQVSKEVSNLYNTAYALGLDHAIDLILAVAKKNERFPADLALLLTAELEKRKPK